MGRSRRKQLVCFELIVGLTALNTGADRGAPEIEGVLYMNLNIGEIELM